MSEIDKIHDNISIVNDDSSNETDKEKKDYEIEFLKQQIKDLESNRGLREKLAICCFVFMCVWACIVFSIIFLSGFSFYSFTLSDSVLITLLTGSTVNVIGLVVVILRGIFPKP